MNVQLSAATDEHGSPILVVEMGRIVLGGIEFDPMTSDYWNFHTVKASRYHTERDDCFKHVWRARTMIANPAGTVKVEGEPRGPSVPRLCWEKTIAHYTRGEVDSVFWVGYSLEQLPQFQDSPMHPLQFVTNVPASRLRFLRRPHVSWCPALTAPKPPPRKKGEPKPEDPCKCGRQSMAPPEVGESPTHGNYLTLLPSRTNPAERRAQVERFVALSNDLRWVPGAVVRPHA